MSSRKKDSLTDSPVNAPYADRELMAGSTAHYFDTTYYDQTYADRREDVDYYERLVAFALQQNPELSVLEYGIGSGRIALTLARLGAQVTGVDLSANMLDACRLALSKEPTEVQKRVVLHHGDMRTLRLHTQFHVVLCTFNTFLHLYTREDIEQFFACVRAHLGSGGQFVFDISVPCVEDLARDPEKAYRVPSFVHPSLKKKVKYTERFSYDSTRQVLFVSMEFSPYKKGDFEPHIIPLAHRQFFPQELDILLHYNGFRVTQRHGGFYGEAFDEQSDSCVLVCERREGA